MISRTQLNREIQSISNVLKTKLNEPKRFCLWKINLTIVFEFVRTQIYSTFHFIFTSRTNKRSNVNKPLGALRLAEFSTSPTSTTLIFWLKNLRKNGNIVYCIFVENFVSFHRLISLTRHCCEKENVRWQNEATENRKNS